MSVNFAFLDSGTGGLPYLKYLKAERPDSVCVYVGDTKNFPYGEKTTGQIIEKSCGCAEKIIKKYPDSKLLDQIKSRFKVDGIEHLTMEKGAKCLKMLIDYDIEHSKGGVTA